MARYTLIVEPLPGDDRPDAVRLRQALKFLRRLRCIGIRPHEPTNEKQAADRSTDRNCLQSKEMRDVTG